MNRSFHKPLGALEIDLIAIFGNFAVGAAGAPTLDVSNSKGILTAVRNSAGKYTITLTEAVGQFLFARAAIVDSTLSDPTAVGVFCTIFSQAVTGASTPTIVIQFVKTSDGTAVDPRNGAAVYFKFDFRNSTVG